ncbi:MAG: SAP domain-containing protein [Thermoplasmatota archaeon]
MRAGDAEFVQILNIISRGQRLIVQAKKEGVDTSLAEEFLSEAKYALKNNKREAAIEYSKKSIYEVVKAKRNLTKQTFQSKEDLSKLTKAELRNFCKQYDLEDIGVKDELVERIWKHLESMPQEIVDAEPIEEKEEKAPKEPEKTEEKPAPKKKPEPEPEPEPEPTPKVWDPKTALEELTPGLSYLVEEKRPDKLFKLYKQAMENGVKGMAISRTNPKILAKRYGLKDSDSIWLTGKEIHGDIRSVLPILEFIMSIIEEFVEEMNEDLWAIEIALEINDDAEGGEEDDEA